MYTSTSRLSWCPRYAGVAGGGGGGEVAGRGAKEAGAGGAFSPMPKSAPEESLTVQPEDEPEAYNRRYEIARHIESPRLLG